MSIPGYVFCAMTLRGFLYEVRQDVRYFTGGGAGTGLKTLMRSPGLRAAQVLGQYVGSRG